MLTPEQKAARDAARTAKKATRKAAMEKTAVDGEKMALALEGVVDEMDARFEDTDESLETVREGLKGMKADVERVISMARTRKSAGSNTEGADPLDFNIGKVVQAFHAKRVVDSSEGEGIGYELEVMVETAKSAAGSRYHGMTKKDLVSSLTGAAGGFPLQQQIRQSIVEAGRSQSVLFSLGVQNDNLEGLSEFAVPYEVQADGKTDVTTGRNLTAVHLQEGGAISASQRPGFRLAHFRPRTLELTVGFTQHLLTLGGGFITEFVKRVAEKDLRTSLERAAMTGRGQQFSEPMGIFNRTDMTSVSLVNALGTDGRFLTPTDLKDFEMSLAEVDRLNGNAKFLTRPAALRGFAHEAATQNLSGATELNSLPRTPMAYMSFDKMAEFMGYKMAMSTNVPNNYTLGSTTTTTAVAYGDWSNVWIPFWGPMDVAMSDVATVGGVSAFEQMLVYMRLIQKYDVNIVDPVSMIVKKGFKTV